MLLSIITINLNNAPGLKKTMDSILAQTSSNYEWIVIDGGSTDGSKELIQAHANSITHWVSEPDSGIYAAMNKGVDLTNGDYLHFLNSGDCYADKDIIRHFLEKSPSADVIYGNAIFVDDADREVKKQYSPVFVRLSDFWHKGGLNHQAMFFSRRCFEHYRYNETNRIASDTELHMHLLYNGFRFEKWDRFVDRFQVGGVSSIILPGDYREFESIVNRVLPPGVKADYEEIIQNRDVDLYILIRRIIASKRWVRNAARLALLPFRILLK